MDEFIRESPIAFWSGVLALLLLVVVWARPWRWPAALRAVSASTTREIARARGIRVEDFERVVPFLERQIRFERDEVTRYSIARASGATPPRWSFVLRTKRLGAQYPHGWVFRADSAPSPALDEILRTIARKEFEDFLEFEADEAEVHAFWYEGGGAEDVDRVENYLRPLAAIGREASASGVGQDVPGPQPLSAADDERDAADRQPRRAAGKASTAARLAFLVLSVGWFVYYVNRLLPVVAAFLGRHVFRPAAGLLALVPGLIVLVLLSRAFTYLDQGRSGAGVQPR